MRRSTRWRANENPARAVVPGPGTQESERLKSAFDETDVAGAWSLRRLLWCEFDALPLAKEFEHGATDRASVEEVLDAPG